MPSLSDPGARQLLDMPVTALIGVGPRGRITLTAQVESLLGYREEELLGLPVDTVLVDPEPVLAVARAEPKSTTRAMFEVPCRRKDGTQFHAEVSVSSVRSTMGAQVWMALREAPEWQRAVVTRNLLAFIAESSGDAIISSTLDGVITFWNPAAERLYGYTEQEMIGSSVERLYPSGRADWDERVPQLADGRAIRGDNVPRVRKDGTVVYVSVTLTPIVDADGHVVGAASVTRDTSAVERADARFRAMLEAAMISIIGVGADGRIVLVNAEAERTFGYDREQLIGQPVEILVPEAYQGIHVSLRHTYLASPRTRRMGEGLALSARRRDGTEFPVDISLSTIDTDDGVLVAAAIRDLTEQAERERLEHVLQQGLRLESLGQLAGGIAHDFNNIMAIISGYTSFIQEDAQDGLDGDAKRACAAIIEESRNIDKAVTRATGLTRQLLAFGRRDVTRPESTDLNALVRDALALLRRTLGEHITIVTTLHPELPVVLVDPGQIEQIIVNAAVNARDAMPGGGTLSIDTELISVDEAYAAQRGARTGSYIRMRIGDTGTGMSKEVVAHAFEPFYTTKPPGEGTGLGLSTIYGIVAHHNGHVAIYSEPGHGTTLSILLPVPSPDSEPAVAPVPAAPAVPADPGVVRTVLVVDDEEDLRNVTERILSRLGHQVLTAADGEQALAVARDFAGPIDLLLTDVIMPKMLGKTLADRLAESRPAMRVLFMSGYAQPVLAAQGTLDAGTALLEKPFTEYDLNAAIAAVFPVGGPAT